MAPVVATAMALAALPLLAQAQSQPQIDPRNGRPGQPITPGQLDDAFQRVRAAEAAAAAAEEERRQEELDRRNAAERDRTRLYRLTCNVVSVITSEDSTRITCDAVRDSYPDNPNYEHATDRSTYWVYTAEQPAFAASSAALATGAMFANRRVRIQGHQGPTDRYTILTSLSSGDDIR